MKAFLTLLISTFVFPGTANAADLLLATDGKSNYQIVIPTQSPGESISESLRQTARLVQAAFKANNFDVNVVLEDKRDKGKPGLYLGDTAFARGQGVDVSKIKGWGYVLKVIGQDVIIAGCDSPGPGEPKGSSRPRNGWDRIGTAKAVADFLREYVGTRFLYPELGGWTSIRSEGKLNLLNYPAFEYLPTPTIAVPSDLDVRKAPLIKFNTGYPRRGSFFDIANNRFPLVDDVFGGHTYGRAVPLNKYRDTHPEYFALVGGKRLVDGHGQYCVSNPDVQELIYQDLLSWLDLGYDSVDLGQPDGFRSCQCKPCETLYETGSDWSEKLWVFHRKLAERVEKARPGKTVSMISYILTAAPPKTFKQFPSNTRIMWCGTNDEDMAKWREHTVPGGFTSYVYNWCPNLGSRYTPMRTPRYVEEQARRLYRNKVQSIYRDGPGDLFGLEGPVYYIMGRMFDDPENNDAKNLMHEFCGAAFGKSGGYMLRFYDQLYHAIEIYSEYLGTRSPAWTYTTIYGQRRKLLSDPFRLLGFLYTPNLMESLNKVLTQAEKATDSKKVTARLALVRREFDYLNHLIRVVHLHQAYQVLPDRPSRDRLLDAIDARNAEIASYYGDRNRVKGLSDWSFVMFPPAGHDANHLRLAYDRYQEPFAESPFNWDTKAMRSAPLPGAKKFTVTQATAAVTKDASVWKNAPVYEFGELSAEAEGARPRTQVALPTPGAEFEDTPAVDDVPRKTSLRMLYDDNNIYIRAECELPAALMKRNASQRADLTKQESIEIYVAPLPGSDIAYQFKIGLSAELRADAASGFVTDAMDPRHGKFDPDWNGDWKYESSLDAKNNLWVAVVTIPFKTIGVEQPTGDTFWRGNVGRNHVPAPGVIRRSMLSVNPQTKSAADKNSFAELVFHVPGASQEPKARKNPLKEWRDEYYGSTFKVPAAWSKLAAPLPTFSNWIFRTDPLEHGIKDKWFEPEVNTKNWLPISIPSFWAEVEEVGKYQGYGWYRTTFQVPDKWKGRTVKLLFGSVDEQAWIYVNGELVREHSEKSEGRSYNELWEEPFEAVVKPAQLNYGKPNVIAVRVHNSKANGGIWRPVFGHAVPAKANE